MDTTKSYWQTIALKFKDIEKMDRESFIKFILETDADVNWLLDLWNDVYCEDYPDDYIFINDEYHFNEQFGENVSPWDIAVKLQGTEYNVNDNYFQFDGYGNPVSFNNPLPYISTSDLADYIMRNGLEDKLEDWEDECLYAFLHLGPDLSELTEEEIENINGNDLLYTNWDELVVDIISDRE